MKLTSLLFLISAPALALAWDAQEGARDPSTPTPTEERIGDPYPLATCPVSGEELGSMGAAIKHLVGGREVRLCCKSCIRKIKKDPAKYFVKLEADIATYIKRFDGTWDEACKLAPKKDA
ncbi:MAG: hypothetical protein ABGY71_01995 [bacterium]|nr:hypothetical protein [Planctomycetota bacterium]HIL51180.1 hypothetical protein [Planctomycetota bacterium]